MSDPRIEKLPNWAKRIIKKLESERVAAIYALNKFTDSQTMTAVFVEDYISTGERQGPKLHYIQSDNVHFRVGNDRITVILEDDHIEIIGGNSLSVFPVSVNAIRIKGVR